MNNRVPDRGAHAMRRVGASALAAALGLAAAAAVAAVAAEDPPQQLAAVSEDLTLLSLEDLMRIEVTSVSKRAEPLSTAAAAIYVLSGEEIRRAGVRSLAEALRLVPGLHVGRTNQSTQQYAISARGFNSPTADKLEVLLDGRSVYTPLFSGVFWDTLDTFMPDIDRIEVIRGPGAALWGANAVNGVINIVTKDAAQTRGLHALGGGGNEERGFGGVRYGMRAGDSGNLRTYAQAFERDDGKRRDGSDAPSSLRLQQAGFRGDWHPAGAHGYSALGDAYQGHRRTDTGDMDLDGFDLQGRWTRRGSERSDFSVAANFDHYHRMIPQVYEETRDTLNLDAQHRLAVGSLQEFVYGLSYRNTDDETGGPPRAYIFAPQSARLETFGAFVQDQIRLAGGDGTLTLGSKFEHNDYTGFEVQPSVRLGWQLRERSFAWAAISRAVRTPNRLDTGLTVFCPPGFPVCEGGQQYPIGDPDLPVEKLIAYESGLRVWGVERWSVDLALFHNDYDDLRSAEASPPFGRFGSGLEGTGEGAEINLNWRALQTLDLRLFYSHLQLDLDAKSDSTDAGTERSVEGSNPTHIAGLVAFWQPAPRWDVHGFLRYVSELPATNIPEYTELNLRVAWHWRPDLMLSLSGTNLLDDQHPEFGIDIAPRLEAQRGVFAQIDWTWD
ncbi:MAG: TonB-dependent receptor [Sinimarinibacterium sp.]|jgi:iron complex outermembrane receptor protein